jgi:sugar phosphate isomerase/epimerase
MPGRTDRDLPVGTPPVILTFNTINFSPWYRADVSLPTVLEAAAAAGFASIGLDVWTVERFEGEGHALPDLVDLMAGLGLACTDVVPLILSPERDVTLQRARALQRVASATGAQTCLVSFGPDGADPRDSGVRSALRECSTIFSECGVRLALEYVAYGPLNTVAAARELCDDIGWERIGLVADSFQTFAAGQTEELRSLFPGAIELVQFSDVVFPLERDLVDASRNHRLLPGAGGLDLQRFVAILDDLGYHGLVSPEVLSQAVRTGPVAGFCRDVHLALRSYWPMPDSHDLDSVSTGRC